MIWNSLSHYLLHLLILQFEEACTGQWGVMIAALHAQRAEQTFSAAGFSLLDGSMDDCMHTRTQFSP